MLAVIEKNLVERVGNMQSKNFSINASSQAYSILSNGLYSDKITAVLRELGTNAQDSHIESKNTDKQFDIHLPTQNEPYCFIRDYGTGLSHENVMNLYTTYFGTNKSYNNEVTGMLGLGSKSPLCYSKSFCVTSFYNNHKKSYIVILNEFGIPQINYLCDQSGPTTEPNGLHIQFAVQQKDISEFYSKAVQVFQYFEYWPNFVGSQKPTPPKINIILAGDGWSVVSGRIGYSGARVVMGCIAYPLVGAKLTGITPNETSLLNQNIEINVEIGDVQFTPSRESLQYTQFTINNVRARLSSIVNEVQVRINEELNKCKNIWEARVFTRNMLYGKNATLHTLRSLMPNLVYKGQNMNIEQLSVKNEVDVHATDICLMAKLSRSKYHSNRETNVVNKLDVNYIIARERTHFYENDIDKAKAPYSRIRKEVDAGICKYGYVVRFESDTGRQSFCKLAGISETDLIKISSLPVIKSVRGPRINKVSSLGSVLVHRGPGVSGTLRDYWKSDKLDNFPNGGVYVEVKNYRPLFHSNNPDDISRALTYLKSLNIDNIDVVGFTNKSLKKVINNPKWVKLEDFIEKSLREALDKDDLGLYNNVAERVSSLNHYENWWRFASFADKNLGGDIGELLNLIRNSKKIFDKNINTAIDQLSYLIGKKDKLVKEYKTIDVENKVRIVSAKYPLLKMIISNVYYMNIDRNMVNTLIDYIKLVEGVK